VRERERKRVTGREGGRERRARIETRNRSGREERDTEREREVGREGGREAKRH